MRRLYNARLARIRAESCSNREQRAERVLAKRPGIQRLFRSGYAMGLQFREDLNQRGALLSQERFGGEDRPVKVRDALDS